MDRKVDGFSLIELITVIVILAIVLMVAMPMYREWIVKYRIESNTKDIYSFLQKMRHKAFVEKVKLDVELSSNSLCVKCDSSDNTCKGIYGKGYISCIDLFNGFSGNTVNISSRGTLNGGPIYYNKSNKAQYDCVRVSDVRIRMDKCNGSP